MSLVSLEFNELRQNMIGMTKCQCLQLATNDSQVRVNSFSTGDVHN